MEIIAKTRGVETKIDIPNNGTGISCLVMQPGMKISVPGKLEINSDTTNKCIKDMTQKEWEHISTGELFIYLFNVLFKEGEQEAYIPKTIEEMQDEDRAVIHGAGLIIQLVESRFNKVSEVFLRTPEDHFHPKQQQRLMSVIMDIQKIPMGGLSMEVEVGV